MDFELHTKQFVFAKKSIIIQPLACFESTNLLSSSFRQLLPTIANFKTENYADAIKLVAVACVAIYNKTATG